MSNVTERFILAVDPGTVQSAFVYWDALEKKIITKGILANHDMLACIESTPCDCLVLEMVESYGMPIGKEVFETVFWIGRFYERTTRPARRIYRKDVKLFLCGSMKAKDGNIRQALIDLIGPQGTKKEPGPTYKVHADEWAALAVAVAYMGMHE